MSARFPLHLRASVKGRGRLPLSTAMDGALNPKYHVLSPLGSAAAHKVNAFLKVASDIPSEEILEGLTLTNSQLEGTEFELLVLDVYGVPHLMSYPDGLLRIPIGSEHAYDTYNMDVRLTTLTSMNLATGRREQEAGDYYQTLRHMRGAAGLNSELTPAVIRKVANLMVNRGEMTLTTRIEKTSMVTDHGDLITYPENVEYYSLSPSFSNKFKVSMPV